MHKNDTNIYVNLKLIIGIFIFFTKLHLIQKSIKQKKFNKDIDLRKFDIDKII